MTTKIKCFCLGALTTLAVISAIVMIVMVKEASDRIDAEKKAELDAYVACVLEQDAKYGWIVRSDCSPNWRALDAKAGFTYTQRGYDIYLNK